MIHMVTAKNRHMYREQMREMHALRKQHFVDERGWTGLTVRDGGEYDDWDDDQAIYFLALDSEGRIGVAMRARPTEDKCILADVFPHLVAPGEPPLKAPGVWEITRIFATHAFRTRAGVKRRTELFLATVEAACRQGVHRLVGMTDLFLLPQTMQAGWRVRMLGLPSAYAEGEVIAVEVDSSPDGARAFQERLGEHAPVALHLDPRSPLAELAPEEAEAVVQLTRRLRPEQIRMATAILGQVLEWQETTSDEGVLAMIERATLAARQSASAAH